MNRAIRLLVFGSAFCFASIASAQTQPTVLAELFRNINCGNCRTPDDTYATYLAQHSNVVLINYHNSTTDPKDPFYLASKDASDAREAELNSGNQLSDPSAFIDGINAQPGGTTSEATWETYSNQALSQPLPPITLTAHKTGNMIVIDYATPGVGVAAPVKVLVVLKESDIHYVNTLKYGATPGDLWNDVMRTILPSPSGTAPFSAVSAHSDSVLYDPSAHPDWNLQNMTAVAFAEDASGATHQVGAVGSLSLASLSAVEDNSSIPVSKLQISGNPITNGSRFNLTLADGGNVQIEMYDLLGRSVGTLFSGNLSAGVSSVPLSMNGLAAGSYIVRMFVNGHETNHARVVHQQ